MIFVQDMIGDDVRVGPPTAPSDPSSVLQPRTTAPPDSGPVVQPALPEPLLPDDEPQNNGVLPSKVGGCPWWVWALLAAAGVTVIGLTYWAVRK